MNKLNNFLETNVGFTIGMLVIVPLACVFVGLGFAGFFKMLDLVL